MYLDILMYIYVCTYTLYKQYICTHIYTVYTVYIHINIYIYIYIYTVYACPYIVVKEQRNVSMSGSYTGWLCWLVRSRKLASWLASSRLLQSAWER